MLEAFEVDQPVVLELNKPKHHYFTYKPTHNQELTPYPSTTVTMSSEARLYTFSQETKDKLRKFRLGTSRSNDPQAVIYMIDKTTHEIKQDEDQVTYKTLEDIADDLPDHTPRFILISYPLTLPSGRLSVPYVMLYWLPETCSNEMRMMYAGAKELMRNTAEVGKVIDIGDEDELMDVPKTLGQV